MPSVALSAKPARATFVASFELSSSTSACATFAPSASLLFLPSLVDGRLGTRAVRRPVRPSLHRAGPGRSCAWRFALDLVEPMLLPLGELAVVAVAGDAQSGEHLLHETRPQVALDVVPGVEVDLDDLLPEWERVLRRLERLPLPTS